MSEEKVVSFNSSSEVHKYLGGIFETAFVDPVIGPKLRGVGIVIKTTYSEPDAVVVIDANTGTVYAGDATTVADAEMSMTAETGNAYWQGKVNLPIAMAKGKVKVKGNIAAFLKLAPLGKQLFPVYIEMLRADGRHELVV